MGANLEAPARRLRWALAALSGLGEIEASSALFRSAPMGPREQPDFCNAVCILRTALSPLELMRALLDLERTAGRVREQRWGPRTLDLDLLHVDGVALQTAELQLPHPGIGQRNFVLVPWAQIAADLVVPGVGCIGELAALIGATGLWPWRDAD
nr:2-amino-4-hydroxy-6-hydroxymethyldihydropteridine diphosphokinase [Solimonas terrae]